MSNKNWDGNVSSLSGEFQTELLGKLNQPDCSCKTRYYRQGYST